MVLMDKTGQMEPMVHKDQQVLTEPMEQTGRMEPMAHKDQQVLTVLMGKTVLTDKMVLTVMQH